MSPMIATDAAPKPETLLGVCQAIGDSFGFDPLWLRLAFVASLLADFELAIAAYAAGAAAVLVARYCVRRVTPPARRHA